MAKDIKVFLSSTFDAEMIKRRDLFRNELNARINNISGTIGYNVFMRDLELGIPNKTDFLDTLVFCFDEVNNCDYFISIIDNNYGTIITEKIGNTTISLPIKYKKVINYGIKNNLSVLELEILIALKNKHIKKIFLAGKNAFCDSNKINLLVKRIKTYGHELILFDNEKDLKDKVLSFFSNSFNSKIIDIEQTNDEINKNKFYANKMRYYVHNVCEKSIINYLNNDYNNPLFLYGEMGCGKSTLLLNITNRNEIKEAYEVIDYWVSIYKSSFTLILQSILERLYSSELSVLLELKNIVRPVNLIYKFYELISNFENKSKKYIIIIDGLDQIDYGEFYDINWIPPILPKNVKVILSTSKKEQILSKLSIECTSIPQMQLIHEMLKKEGKLKELYTFGNYLKLNTQISTPLFLRTIVTEILTNEKYITLKKSLLQYSRIISLNNLYSLYFSRLERIFGKEVLIKLFSLLYFSKKGLTIEEIEKLGRPLDVMDLFYMLYFEFINCDDTFNFSNEYLRKEIEKRYIYFENEKMYRNEILQHYAQYGYRDTRVVGEITYQLEKQRDSDLIYNFFLDHINVEISFASDKELFLSCLRYIEQLDPLIEHWCCILNDLSLKYEINYLIFSALFYFLQIFDCSIKYGEYAIKYTQKLDLKLNAIKNLAYISYELGSLDECFTYYKDSISLAENLFKNEIELSELYNQYGRLLLRLNECETALEIVTYSLKINQKYYSEGSSKLLGTYCILAEIYAQKGDYVNALKYTDKIDNEIMYTKNENIINLSLIYNNLAIVFYKIANYKKAKKYIDLAISIGENHNFFIINSCYTNAILIYTFLDAIYYSNKIEYLIHKALKIDNQLSGQNNDLVILTYINIALSYRQRDMLIEAEKYIDIAFNCVVNPKNNINLFEILNLKALISYGLNKIDDSKLYINLINNLIKENKNYPLATLGVFYNTATMVFSDDIYKARQLAEKALNINSQILLDNYIELAISYTNISFIYTDLKISSACKFIEMAIKIYINVYGEKSIYLAKKFRDAVYVFFNFQKYNQALDFIEKAILIFSNPEYTNNFTNELNEAYAEKELCLLKINE